jgi:Uma2 family endonuclease
MATAEMTQVHARERITLWNVSWEEYSQLLELFEHRPGWRLSYDKGVLEIMSPSSRHEGDADMLGRFVAVITEELELPAKGGRCTTYRREDLERGLEADNSYWIANEWKVRCKRDIDLNIDPPPDLAIEIDVTSSSRDRMGIYAALGVPEIWHGNEQGLTFLHLKKGKYVARPTSLAFPWLKPADLADHLALRATMDETAVVAKFRLWFRHKKTELS